MFVCVYEYMRAFIYVGVCLHCITWSVECVEHIISPLLLLGSLQLLVQGKVYVQYMYLPGYPLPTFSAAPPSNAHPNDHFLHVNNLLPTPYGLTYLSTPLHTPTVLTNPNAKPASRAYFSTFRQRQLPSLIFLIYNR